MRLSKLLLKSLPVLSLLACAVAADERVSQLGKSDGGVLRDGGPVCPAGPRPLRVGEEVTAVFESAHPYGSDAPPPPAGARLAEVVTTFEIGHPNATYIAPHFAAFDIEEGDFVLVRSPDGTRAWRYDGGPTAREPFWGIAVPGPLAVVELHRVGTGGRYGFRIDQYARGLTRSERASDPCLPLGICGADNSNWGACYSASEPSIYNRGRTVARLLINGANACTGWLIGSQGHLITNAHCIGTAADAANTQVEFMAEGATCATDCGAWLACPGTIEAVSTTLVKSDQPLDYALVKPVTAISLPSKYGYLQVRASGAVVNERIYIPQHPLAWGKRIAVLSSQDPPSGFARVTSLTEPPSPTCTSPSLNVGYYADTEHGSSGSPVLGYTDHLVVALHHCTGCPNRGVPIQDVLADLGAGAPPCTVPALGCPPTGLNVGPGGGECVACNGDSDCTLPATCTNNRCVTASFSVGIGGTCCDSQQCQSHNCGSGGTCQSTGGKAECEHCTFNNDCASEVLLGRARPRLHHSDLEGHHGHLLQGPAVHLGEVRVVQHVRVHQQLGLPGPLLLPAWRHRHGERLHALQEIVRLLHGQPAVRAGIPLRRQADGALHHRQ